MDDRPSGPGTTPKPPARRPTPPPGHAASTNPRPTNRGTLVRRLPPSSVAPSPTPSTSSACAPASTAAGPSKDLCPSRTRVPSTTKRSHVLSSSTVFFCARGGDFLYPFPSEKRQTLARGHTFPARSRPLPRELFRSEEAWIQ